MARTNFTGPVQSDGGFEGPLLSLPEALASAGVVPNAYKIGLAGDSIPAASFDTATANTIRLRNFGHLSWLLFLTRQRVSFGGAAYMAAVPGMTAGGLAGTDTIQPNAAQAAAAYTALLASDVGWVDLTIGTNDVVATSTAYAKFVTDYGLLVDRAIAAGKRLMLTPILPRTAGMDAAKRRLAGRFNDYIWSRHNPKRGVYVTDPTPAWADYSSTGPRANFTYDGLHPSAQGAYWIAKVKADVINQALPAIDRLFDNSDNVWNADNPTGNLLANGMMAGTGGALANSATGSVPTSWTGTRASGGQAMTVAFSKVAHTSLTGLEWAAMTLGGTSTADGLSTAILRQDYSLSGTPIAAGDIVEAFVDVEISGQSNVQAVTMLSRLIMSGNYTVEDGLGGNSASLLIPEGITLSGVLRTPRLVAPAGTITGARFDLTAVGGPNTNAVAGLVKFGRAFVKRVA